MKIAKYTNTVRDLLNLSEEGIWKLERPGLMDLTFDDGVTIYNASTVDVIISWYYWQVAIVYREIKIPSTLFLNGNILTDRTHRDLLMMAIRPTIGTDINKEDVWLIAYRDIYNKLYNAIVSKLMRFVRSTDVPHILEILFDKDVYEANSKVTDSMATIDRAYDALTKVLDTKYPTNPITQSKRYQTVKLEQLKHSFAPRGRTTDIDSNIYKRPIKRGHAMGFRTINDMCKDSRSAAKALLFNKDPVAEAEYFNRKLQLVCAVIRRIVRGDCGATNLHEIDVPVGELGLKVIGDLAGLYHRLPSGELHLIDKHDKHLCGKTIQLRTTMTCLHLPKQCVCEKCYGITSYSIPWDTNPGHVSCTAINERITQLIISTKHLDFIDYKFKVLLSQEEKIYMDTDDFKPENIYLNKKLAGKTITLRIRKKEADKLVTISNCHNLLNVIPSNITSLNVVDFFIVGEGGVLTNVEQYDLVKEASRPSLSLEMLQYMKKHSWDLVGDYYHIEIKPNWKFSDPIFSYPLKHDSMAEFADRFERFVRSCNAIKNGDDDSSGCRKSSVRLHSLNKYRNTSLALMDCYYLITEKLNNVHIGHIATVLAASRAQDPASGNYNMPAGISTGAFASHNSIIAGRSGANAALFEKQADWFDSLDSHLIKDRHSSNLDDMIYIPRK